jgi:hypothetical protein
MALDMAWSGYGIRLDDRKFRGGMLVTVYCIVRLIFLVVS